MVTAALFGVAVTIAGCSADHPGESLTDAVAVLEAPQVATRYGYNAETSDLSPIFALVPEFRSLDDGYARDLLASACLDGVIEYRAVRPGEPDRSAVNPRTGQLVFDVSVAQVSGYPYLRENAHFGQTGGGVPNGTEISAEVYEKMLSCGQLADERLGSPPERLLNGIDEVGWAAVDTDARMVSVIAEWRACMAPVGLVDLPDEPQFMPPASVVNRGSDTLGVEAPGVVLTEREREVAVADATCREQVGYDRVMFEIRVESELAEIGRNIEAFEAVRSEYKEYQAGVEQVIAELG